MERIAVLDLPLLSVAGPTTERNALTVASLGRISKTLNCRERKLLARSDQYLFG